MKYIKILSILLCVLATSTSCNKWLDVKLNNIVNEDDLFTTEQGYQEALAGVYASMAQSSMYGGTLSMEYLDLYARYYGATSTASKYAEHLVYNYTDAAVEGVHLSMWRNLYSGISGANNIIRFADNDTEVLSSAEKNQIKGEAVALRAFLHFDVIRLFCSDVKLNPKEAGIPYNKVFGVSLPPQYTVEECVQLVLNDLNEAEQLLDGDPIKTTAPYMLDNKNDADKFVARMNYYAVKAMKARLYLMRGDNVNALKYAKEVIESGQFQLLDFSDIDRAEAETDMLFSDEHIFSLRNGKLQDAVKALFVSSTTDGVTTIAPLSFSDYSVMYDSNNDDMRYVKWFNVGGDYKFMKYLAENTDFFFSKVPMITLSEMYLICAEATFNTDIDESLGYINTLRDHRIRNNKHWQYLTEDYIFDEMKREFVGEGQLWYAYKRLNKKIPTGTVEGDLDPSDDIYVFPMPSTEVDNGGRE